MPINASKKEIYQSYQMFNEDNDFMCYVNEKRANWYIKKGLASWIGEKEFKLNFKPKGNGKKEIVYYSQSLENKCVVCGEKDGSKLNKHHVVPYVFRSRFPIQYKESNHHDILVTCIECHDKYEHTAMDFKNKLAKDANIKMNYPLTEEEIFNKKILSARNVINKINNGELRNNFGDLLIPENKLNILKELSLKELIPIKKRVGDFWADELMNEIKTEEDLFKFIKKWRNHFLIYAKPKYLPKHWSVDHPLERSY